MEPLFEIDYFTLKFLTESYPYSLVRHLTGTQPTPHPKPSRQTRPKPIIRSTSPKASDTFHGGQQPAWKPVEPSQDDGDDDFYYSDEDYKESMRNKRTPSLRKYLQLLLSSIRYIAINARLNNGFPKPKATLNTETKQGNGESSFGAENDSDDFKRICEVLMLSGLSYSDCDALNEPITLDEATLSSPWTNQDERGVRWKEVTDGKDKGCRYFIKDENIPLKVSATPNPDGTTHVTYFTKNTIGKFCAEDGDEKAFKEFSDSLDDEMKPSKLTAFLTYKLFKEFTIYDLFEFQFVFDACIFAIHNNLNDREPLSAKSLFGFFMIYSFLYYIYYNYFKYI
ncbi:hypothetical protein MBANPS3_002490 [Mucor bainieri]